MRHFDPFDKDKWLTDHCPTYMIPSFPMMGVVAVLLDLVRSNFASHGQKIQINSLQLVKFIPADRPFALDVKFLPLNSSEYKAQVFFMRDQKEQMVANAVISFLKEESDAAIPPVEGELINPYEDGLFHERLFQWTNSVVLAQDHSLATIQIKSDNAVILLDNMLHGIPHDNLHRWCSRIAASLLALPTQIHHFKLYQPLPITGEVQVYAQFGGFYKELHHFPCFQIKAWSNKQLLVDFLLVEALFPKTKIGLNIQDREAFIRYRHYVEDYGLSEYQFDQTVLAMETVKQANWFEGALSYLYNSSGDLKQLTRKIAIQEHLARQLKMHPSQIEVLGWNIARSRIKPVPLYVMSVEEEEKRVVIRDLVI